MIQIVSSLSLHSSQLNSYPHKETKARNMFSLLFSRVILLFFYSLTLYVETQKAQTTIPLKDIGPASTFPLTTHFHSAVIMSNLGHTEEQIPGKGRQSQKYVPWPVAPTLTSSPGSTVKVEIFLALCGLLLSEEVQSGPTLFSTERKKIRKPFHDLSRQRRTLLFWRILSRSLIGHRG